MQINVNVVYCINIIILQTLCSYKMLIRLFLDLADKIIYYWGDGLGN